MNKISIHSKPKRFFVRYKKTIDGFSTKKDTIFNTTFLNSASTLLIQKVKTILEENLDDENFGIHALCKAIGLSRAQLHNRIKADTGVSTSIYIRNVRLENAKILLQATDLNATEIAYQVGFKCSRYFSTLFL